MGYKFRIEYKKGSLNRAADALSCQEELATAEPGNDPYTVGSDEVAARCDSNLLVVVAHPIPNLLDLLRRETISSPELRELTAAIRDTTGSAPHDARRWAGIFQTAAVFGSPFFGSSAYFNRIPQLSVSGPSRVSEDVEMRGLYLQIMGETNA